jgi:voltage-gated potassium channel
MLSFEETGHFFAVRPPATKFPWPGCPRTLAQCSTVARGRDGCAARAASATSQGRFGPAIGLAYLVSGTRGEPMDRSPDAMNREAVEQGPNAVDSDASGRGAPQVPHHVRTGWRAVLHGLYYGEDLTAHRFRLGLLALDLLTIAYFIVSSMLDPMVGHHPIDYLIAAVLACELAARWTIANNPRRFLFRFGTIIDLIVILSLTAPLIIENLAFLRVVRMLRLLRSYHVMHELRRHWRWLRVHEDVVQSAINIVVFVFVVTAIVFVVEGHRNPQINNYVDALYFTVTTLTTTGFGDITMQSTAGRLLAVAIMVLGVALFLRLIQTIFRPPKLHFRCTSCGLNLHEFDAVHCKRCGEILKYHPPLDEG